MKKPKPSAKITAHLAAIKQALATSPSTLPARSVGVRVIPAYVPFRHCENIFIKLREERDLGIQTLMSEMTDKVNEYLSILDKRSRREASHLLGVSNGRERCSMRYDTQFAPMSTNRKMMDMIGITISPTDTGWTTLCMIVHGLAAWDIFITESNHLNDEQFLLALQHLIDAPVRLVPPGNGNPEWISVAGYNADSPSIPICDRTVFLPAPVLKAGVNYKAVRL
jgi:hypothetical protein